LRALTFFKVQFRLYICSVTRASNNYILFFFFITNVFPVFRTPVVSLFFWIRVLECLIEKTRSLFIVTAKTIISRRDATTR